MLSQRRRQAEFVSRGLASREDARKLGDYFTADEILIEMENLLSQAKTKAESSH